MMYDLRCSESTTNQAQGGELLCRLAPVFSPCLRVNWRDRLSARLHFEYLTWFSLTFIRDPEHQRFI
jgi:hypothetical protein